MKLKGKAVYVRVTNDKYRLITAIADSVNELAEICGVQANTISAQISRAKKTGKAGHYERVEIDDDE